MISFCVSDQCSNGFCVVELLKPKASFPNCFAHACFWKNDLIFKWTQLVVWSDENVMPRMLPKLFCFWPDKSLMFKWSRWFFCVSHPKQEHCSHGFILVVANPTNIISIVCLLSGLLIKNIATLGWFMFSCASQAHHFQIVS